MDLAAALTMSKARHFKKRADTVLEEIFRSMFEEIDTDKLKKEIDELRAGAPEWAPARHARMLTRRTAIRCAAAGAVTGLPLGIAALGTLSADVAYLVYQQFRLILGIATIYGHEPSSRERFNEALEIVDAALTNPVVNHSGKYWKLENLTLMPGVFLQPSPPKWTTVVSTGSAQKSAQRRSRI